MKKTLFVLLPLLACFFLQGCLKDKMTRTYTMLKPVYKEKTEVYANIKSNAPAEIKAPGKIFMIGNYIFLNEVDKGVHIIDNTNPASPVIKAFINIPGNLDIAVKGNTLYADLYTDLVVVDISDPLQARYVRHINNIFPQRMYDNGFMGDSSRVIVDWIRKDTTVDINYSPCSRCEFMVLSSSSQMGTAAPGGGTPTGIAGSMARFSVVNNFLYTVNHSNLSAFDIAQAQHPVKMSTQHVGWNIETIYPFSNKLFIGSTTGMFIYDISNPASPVAQGQFSHVRRCDPVVADGNYAYVTLRTGNTCPGNTNELNVVNISNIMAPSLARAYPLTSPHGLSKDQDLLFVCDGSAGLKMYDASNPLDLKLKKQVTDLDTYDAIAWNGNLLVVGKDGLYQYGYSFPDNLVLKSKLTVKR